MKTIIALILFINLPLRAQSLSPDERYLNCDANTPEVSLEEKVPYPGANFAGPFFGVPRDNQDGLGTCYANAAKNLLVSASQGQDVASYLDIAVTHQVSGGFGKYNINGGESCDALKRLNAKGYCPQSNAPMEMGEKNSYAPGSNRSISDQGTRVELLQKFLSGRTILEKGNNEFSGQVLKQSKVIAQYLKLHANVKIPMAIVRHPIPASWKLQEFQAVYGRQNPGVNKDQVMNDYRQAYQKFYPDYIRAVVAGNSRDQIFDIFTSKMSAFISKYNLASEMKGWKMSFMGASEQDATDPKLKTSIAESLAFMKLISGKADQSDIEFFKFCESVQADSLEFLADFQPLIKHLDESEVATDELFDKDGKFKAPGDMMQLLVAPACLHPENRKKFSSPIHCETGRQTIYEIKASALSLPQQIKQLRGKVISNLLQGYAMGNTFNRHINTIVGLRFNKEQNRCEYKIRESQDGTSTWQPETQIFGTIEALTEVRRQ